MEKIIKLDDFLSKKKEPTQVLDLSKVKITSKEEFKKYFDKIPDCKVKPEKILLDQIKVKEKNFTFVSGKKDEKYIREWNYPEPVPPEMKGVKLEDLCPVNIDWKMLTTIRPKSKAEEDMFSRLVQLGKLDLKHQQFLKREKLTDWIRRTKNPKSSITEMRVVSCRECGEDFCDGRVCSKLTYENFFRLQPTTSKLGRNLLLLASESDGKKVKRKRKSKKKKKKATTTGTNKKSRKKSHKTSSIFNRPASTGCTRDHSSRIAEVKDKIHSRALSSTRSVWHERRRQDGGFPSKRSKSAPGINFVRDVSASEFKRHEYISDSALSNTDYSTQSDSENPDFHQGFFSSSLSLSGSRKRLSARVSFADRRQRREMYGNSRLNFTRQCTLRKNHCDDGSFRKKFNRKFHSSGSSISGSVSESPEKNFFGPSSSGRKPSTVQIQFDEFSPSGLKRFPEKRKISPVGYRWERAFKGKNIAPKKSAQSNKSAKEDPARSGPKAGSKRSEIEFGNNLFKSKTISPDSCLKARGLFGKKNQIDLIPDIGFKRNTKRMLTPFHN